MAESKWARYITHAMIYIFDTKITHTSFPMQSLQIANVIRITFPTAHADSLG